MNPAHIAPQKTLLSVMATLSLPLFAPGVLAQRDENRLTLGYTLALW